MYSIVAYVPAIHQGYLDFFVKYPGDIFLIDAHLLEDKLPRLERDLRAMNPSDVASMLRTLPNTTGVNVLKVKGGLKALDEETTIIMPDEDVSRTFADKYLMNRKIRYESTFLRWDKQISITEMEISSDRTVTSDIFARKIISLTNLEANKSPDWWRQVGAAVVREDKIILMGYNKPFPEEIYSLGAFGDPRSNFDAGEHIELSKAIHAEAELIARAARSGLSLLGSDLYVTTFPCPVCAKSVAAAGIKCVYYEKGYSLLDAEDVLKSQGVEIVLVDTNN